MHAYTNEKNCLRLNALIIIFLPLLLALLSIISVADPGDDEFDDDLSVSIPLSTEILEDFLLPPLTVTKLKIIYFYYLKTILINNN